MDPYAPATPEARALALSLLEPATFAALATIHEGRPMVTRIGCLWLPGQGMGMLISDLSDHAKALVADPACALLVGEPAEKGDPLTHPRITLRGTARAIDKAAHRDHWLAHRPKATIYYDFTDFRLLAVAPDDAMLNGGFGKAHRLTAADL
ncbi:MAG: pyridoxamine 5'-phosphate oxidase family protein [Pseudomonadota bacterium]